MRGRIKIVLCLMAGLILAGTAGAFAQSPYAGETITVAVHAVPHATAVYNFQDQFLKETGIKVKVIEMTADVMYEKYMTEFIGGTGAYDVVQMNPQWLADTSPYLAPLKPLADKEGLDFKLDDLVPKFRDLYCSWLGVWYGMPWDGDVHLLYYRKDIFDKLGIEVPKTWKEYRDTASFLNGWDWDDDGEIEYGCTEYLKKDRMYWWFLDRFACYGGVYFDEDMNPLINTKSGMMALKNMVECLPYMPPGSLGWSYMEVRTALTKGDAAMGKQWTCVGKAAESPEESKVVGKMGYALVPGAQWDGEISYRPMIAGGWDLTIPKDSKKKGAAITFLQFITRPDISLQIVMDPNTSLDPYRLSHYTSPAFRDLWPTAGDYLDAINANLDKGFPDLLIPGSSEYMNALTYEITQVLAGTKDAKKALDDAAKAWNEITDNLDRETQKKLWNGQYDAMKALGIVYKEWKD